MTYLEKDFDTLQWCNHCLCQAACNATRQEFLQMKAYKEYRSIPKL